MPVRVWILWALFLVRGAFYCTMFPLWEGWDEYGHFAWIGHTLPGRADRISREIDESMRLAPLPRELEWIGPPYLTHEQWWALAPAERADREARLRALSPELAHQPAEHPLMMVEAQQAPLYYWIVSAPLRMMRAWPIGRRVWATRLISMAIASLVIPVTWLAGRLALDADLAFCSAGLLAVAPGFAIDMSRVANDSLATLFVALLVWLLMRRAENRIGAGSLLGAALLAKAYVLALIPAVPFARRRMWKALPVALVIAGWWYARNVWLYHSLSGWLDEAPLPAVARAAMHVNWPGAVHVWAKSFFWFGAWSFVVMRSWIYMILEGLGLAALIGGLRFWRGALRVPLIFAGFFALSIVYNAASNAALGKGAGTPGWYFWALACPLAVLYASGARWWVSVAAIAAFALVDLYGSNSLLMPYYAGFVPRNHAGTQHVFAALARLRVPVVLWAAYLLSTLGIPLLVWKKAGGK